MREDVAMDREEFWVHCEACQHEWIALYTPMEMGIVAKILKGAHCPMCATNAKQIATGKYPHATPQGDPLAWIAGGDTGKSSKTIWYVMMGRKLSGPFGADVPYDPSDFGRCSRLLALMPAWRDRLSEVASKYPAWSKLVANWDKIQALYDEELPSGTAPKCYDLIQKCIGRRRRYQARTA